MTPDMRVSYDSSELTKNLVFCVTVDVRFGWRLRLGVWITRIGVRLIGGDLEVKVKE